MHRVYVYRFVHTGEELNVRATAVKLLLVLDSHLKNKSLVLVVEGSRELGLWTSIHE